MILLSSFGTSVPGVDCHLCIVCHAQKIQYYSGRLTFHAQVFGACTLPHCGPKISLLTSLDLLVSC